MKKSLYALAWTSLLMLNEANAALPAQQTPNTNLQWTTNTADTAIQNIISNVITFLYIIAVIYWLWWGFNILTAGWDEEKVKNWKKVIINALIWIVVIFLASSIVNFVLNSILKGA
jgi:ABC-type multidrug transport system fused ATPase/permease subunit